MARTRTRTFRVVPDDPKDWDLFLKDFLGGLTDVETSSLADVQGLSVMGRAINTSGAPGDITAGSDGQVLRRSGSTLGFGTVATAGITDDAVTDAKIRDSAALSVMGRATNTDGNPADIAAGTDGHVLRRAGTAIGFGTIATAGITDDAVTNDKLADMLQSTIKGRAAGAGTGNPSDLTAAQVAAIISSEIATALNITSGVYTPTLTGVINIAASGALQCQYVRIGTVVIVSGRLTVDPTAAAASELGISLPIASNLGAVEDLGGVAFANAVAGQGAAVLGDPVNDRASMVWVAVDTANRAMSFIFMYRVI